MTETTTTANAPQLSDTQIETLHRILSSKRDKLQQRTQIILGVFATLVVLLLISTTIAYKELNEIIGPQGFEEAGTYAVNRMANLGDQFGAAYMKNREQWADMLVDETIALIPRGSDYLKQYVSVATDGVTHELLNSLTPNTVAYLRANLPQLRQEFLEMKKKNPELTPAHFFVDKFIDVVDHDLSRILREEEVLAQATELQKKLYRLHKKEGKLTRKELAERKILVAFMEMTRWGTEGSIYVGELKRLFEKYFQIHLETLEKKEVMKDVSDKEEVREL